MSETTTTTKPKGPRKERTNPLKEDLARALASYELERGRAAAAFAEGAAYRTTLENVHELLAAVKGPDPVIDAARNIVRARLGYSSPHGNGNVGVGSQVALGGLVRAGAGLVSS